MPSLNYIGHSAFLLEDDQGNVVVVDPFITGNPAATIDASAVHPNTILITHAHNDHVGDTVDLAKANDARVITIVELADWLEEQGVGNVIGLNHGGSTAFPGGAVKIVPAWHSSSYNDGEQLVANGVPAGLVVRFGGVTFYFAGDTALFSDMRLIGDEGIDVAILPIGDHFTMGPADAARAAEFVGAKTVIPCHYNTFPPIRQDPETFRARVAKRAPESRVVILAPGETWQAQG
ncbi:MAG: metal-dependent hydrolase [Thermomicrobiales bacterium]|nr:metal-dependent hydrolase [Thermomicrobiales bacterium]